MWMVQYTTNTKVLLIFQVKQRNGYRAMAGKLKGNNTWKNY